MGRAVGDRLAADEPLVHDVDRGLVARGIIMHLEGDGPPRPRAAAHLVELEAHERLDERALPGGLGADHDDRGHLRWHLGGPVAAASSTRATSRAKIAAVKPRDQVVTGGGIVGKVTRVDDDYADVEIAQGVKVKVVKATLAEVTPLGTAKPAND